MDEERSRQEAVIRREMRRAGSIVRQEVGGRVSKLLGRSGSYAAEQSELQDELDTMRDSQAKLHKRMQRTRRKLDADAHHSAEAVLAIEEEARVWRKLEAARAGRALDSRLAGAAAASAAHEAAVWERRLPGHVRLGAEFGLRKEEQQFLLERRAEEAAAKEAEAAARRGPYSPRKPRVIQMSASLPALMINSRHGGAPAVFVQGRPPREIPKSSQFLS